MHRYRKGNKCFVKNSADFYEICTVFMTAAITALSAIYHLLSTSFYLYTPIAMNSFLTVFIQSFYVLTFIYKLLPDNYKLKLLPVT